MEDNILELARVKAVQEKDSLSGIVEKALKKYLPPAIGIQLTDKGATFHSGPTITSLSHDKSILKRK